MDNEKKDNKKIEDPTVKIPGETNRENKIDNGEGFKKTEVAKKKKNSGEILKIFSIIMLAVLFWLALVQYLAADKYDVMVRVKSEDSATGVNPTGEKLDYGDIPKGSSMIRSITVENGGNMDVYIGIIKYGGIAELIDEEDNGFVLAGGEKKNVEFLLDVPISASEKEYKGKVLIFKLPKIF